VTIDRNRKPLVQLLWDVSEVEAGASLIFSLTAPCRPYSILNRFFPEGGDLFEAVLLPYAAGSGDLLAGYHLVACDLGEDSHHYRGGHSDDYELLLQRLLLP
jgi:hypothetical protein